MSTKYFSEKQGVNTFNTFLELDDGLRFPLVSHTYQKKKERKNINTKAVD